MNYRNAGGQLFVGETLGTPLFGVDGEVLGNIGVIRDVTLRKKAEEKLTLSASVFTHAREGIMITDASGIIVEVNDTFSLITGYSREEAAGIIPTNFRTDRHGANFYTSLWSALQEHGYWHGEVWHHRKTGEEYAALLTISAVHDESGAVGHYVALFTDITEIKEHQRQLEEIAHYDPLTGLPNRVLLADRLEQSIVQSRRRASPLAVAYLDLDDFKIVNDTHGHAVGDELLVELSRRMKNVLREGDTLARLGGDEFVAVLADMHTVDDCDPLLSRLLEAATSPVRLGDFSLRVSVSIGVTLFPQDHVDPDQLVRHADQAMYLAKQMGKNRYRIFDVVGDAKIKSRGEVLENNRNALRRNEFVMYYQPIVNMGSGEVIGVEALIRWQHPERGLLLPADFLPSVENHSTSIDIGDWVIDTVLAQIAEWRASGTNLRVSVNVGAGQLQRSDFVAKLANALARYPTVSSADLELEILETSALTNIETVTSIISECGNLGVSFALDDFGTGYSSLNYLKGFPADVLKIDQSFVIGMLDNQDDRSIVSAVIGLASAFQRQVVAEGVESVAHGAQLLRMGCEYAQGYVIARPMRAGDIPSWLRDWKPDASWTKIADAMGTAIDPPTDS
ncbi:MAG: diguanylate cyclase (GGDEF)-like protein/PAS domain S-box-containing protein [Halieaceae bacterium]